MKVLILTPWFPPAYRAGGPVKSLFNLVNQELEGIEYSVITADSDVGGFNLEGIVRNKWTPFNENTRVIYLGRKGRISRIHTELKRLKPDVVFITGIYSPSFTMAPLLLASDCKIILSARGMLHPPALRQKWLKKRIFLSLLKPLVKFRKVVFHATDESEKEHIRSAIGANAIVEVASNFPSFYEPSLLLKDKGKLHLITIALISPMKNHLMVLEALRKVRGEVHYHICGPAFDARYWESCLSFINDLPSNIYVHYHGPINPVEVRKYLSMSHVFICPSESENFGHALFEGMTAGKPLITSLNTPWNKLEDNKAGLNIDPSPGRLAEGIQFFIDMDQEKYAAWSKSAADYARKSIDLDAVKNQYIKLFSLNKN